MSHGMQVATDAALDVIDGAGAHDTDASLHRKLTRRLEDRGFSDPGDLALRALNAVAGDSEPDGTLDRRKAAD